MAEGLNLHQRCFHLIHLDLPYNPNRLEQRNGRIDRYGQTHDPEIRYLYLAGTFEERLLLRLIAKYEKARACLAVMPDTLGVTADEAAWSKGLVAGFAEDQAALFEDDAPAIRTLDQVAETSNAAAFRDLLHEIDRAFAGPRAAFGPPWLAGGAKSERRFRPDGGGECRAAAQRRLARPCRSGRLRGRGDRGGNLRCRRRSRPPATPGRLDRRAGWSARLRRADPNAADHARPRSAARRARCVARVSGPCPSRWCGGRSPGCGGTTSPKRQAH